MVRVPPFPLLSSLARASWMFFSAVSSRASITSNAWSCIPGLAHLNLRKSLAGTFNSNAASVTLQPWRARAATTTVWSRLATVAGRLVSWRGSC